MEEEVALERSGARLVGTFIPPVEDNATCLMLHGTGPCDRDENMTGQKLDIFNALADCLAEQSIGSLRYDKRGCGESTGDYYSAGHQDLVADAKAWIKYLHQEQLIPTERIVLLGHSEGTLIGAELAADDPSLGGLILLCPFAQNLEDVLKQQAHLVDEGLRKVSGIKGLMLRAFFGLKGGVVKDQMRMVSRANGSTKRTIRVGFQKIPAQSFREMMALDIQAIYREVRVPVLMIAGAKDLQCDPGDVGTIETCLQGEYVSFVVDDLTHILRKEPGEHTFFTYDQIMNQPIDSEVLTLLVDHFPNVPTET